MHFCYFLAGVACFLPAAFFKRITKFLSGAVFLGVSPFCFVVRSFVCTLVRVCTEGVSARCVWGLSSTSSSRCSCVIFAGVHTELIKLPLIEAKTVPRFLLYEEHRGIKVGVATIKPSRNPNRACPTSSSGVV